MVARRRGPATARLIRGRGCLGSERTVTMQESKNAHSEDASGLDPRGRISSNRDPFPFKYVEALLSLKRPVRSS
jgi:hypothetical protein